MKTIKYLSTFLAMFFYVESVYSQDVSIVRNSSDPPAQVLQQHIQSIVLV